MLSRINLLMKFDPYARILSLYYIHYIILKQKARIFPPHFVFEWARELDPLFARAWPRIKQGFDDQKLTPAEVGYFRRASLVFDNTQGRTGCLRNHSRACTKHWYLRYPTSPPLVPEVQPKMFDDDRRPTVRGSIHWRKRAKHTQGQHREVGGPRSDSDGGRSRGGGGGYFS